MPINLVLPPPLILSTVPLVGLHCAQLGIDYILLRDDRCMIPKRMMMGGVHVFLPLALATRHDGCNLFLAAIPWFYAAYSTTLPMKQLSVQEWMESFNAIVLDVPDSVRAQIAEKPYRIKHVDARGTRQKGVMRMARGVIKLVFMHYCLDRLLPNDPASMLSLPWCHLSSLGYTLLYGCKAYTFLGVADVGMGIQQLILGLPQIDLFDAPILATSPKDFWSRRWSRPVRNLFHRIFYQTNNSLSTTSRGLMAFLTSGIMHELLVMCLCRRLTLENMAFFTLHGLAVMAQVALSKRLPESIIKSAAQPIIRVGCIIGNLGFFAMTGRLFLAPYLRHYASCS